MDRNQPHGSTERPITRQCTAMSKRSRERCRKPAMRGRTVCLAHGGRTPRGAASPHFETGRHSRSLPGHLVATYEQARRDPTRLSLREDLALTDAMIAELLRQLADDSPESAYRRVFRQVGELMERKRRLMETEVRHIVRAREMLTAEEVLALMRAVIAIVGRYLPDATARASFVEEMHALMNNGPQTPLGAHRYG